MVDSKVPLLVSMSACLSARRSEPEVSGIHGLNQWNSFRRRAGANVGIADGIVDGTDVGMPVVISVGKNDVRTEVGKNDGSDVADTFGKAVGSNVGSTDGKAVEALFEAQSTVSSLPSDGVSGTARRHSVSESTGTVVGKLTALARSRPGSSAVHH
jgi:hypothetical protein